MCSVQDICHTLVRQRALCWHFNRREEYFNVCWLRNAHSSSSKIVMVFEKWAMTMYVRSYARRTSSSFFTYWRYRANKISLDSRYIYYISHSVFRELRFTLTHKSYIRPNRDPITRYGNPITNNKKFSNETSYGTTFKLCLVSTFGILPGMCCARVPSHSIDRTQS